VQLLLSLRPRQWVKNLFVLAPLVFAEHAADGALAIRAALAFLLFGLLSGCVYLLNDIVDVEADRAHPVKRNRPIASGRLPVATARMSLAVLLLVAVGASFFLDVGFAAVGMAYFVLNVGYSFALKHLPYIDVLTIASGFILRLFAGALAIDVPLSLWLGLCTFLLATYLGLGKRRHELVLSQETGAISRKVLASYGPESLARVMTGFAVATAVAYGAYVLLGETLASYSPQALWPTIPSVLFGLARFATLTSRGLKGQSPTDAMLSDWPFVANVLVWTGLVVWVIYIP
jgi:decaprenyl-phosphate phosphoribosyltransferase